MSAGAPSPSVRLLNLVAELTHRCPLQCPYCSNPLALAPRRDELDTATWTRIFREAADLGAVHLGLTGGEPSVRDDLPELVASARDADLYTHLVTAARPLDPAGLARLRTAGLDSVQISIQDAEAGPSDEIAGTESFAAKCALARATRELGLPLTLNVVLHRRNLGRVGELIELARELDADRIELANTQYLGWALRNRDALLPTRAAIERAAEVVREARRHGPRPEILFVLPDYFRGRPKPCTGGWGRRHAIVAPDGRVLPCHGASALPDLEFWSVRDHSLADCWERSPGIDAYRGEAWMREPCRSCPSRGDDFGGCRCQAFALLGDAARTDPACELSPDHAVVRAAREEDPAAATSLVYRSTSAGRG